MKIFGSGSEVASTRGKIIQSFFLKKQGIELSGALQRGSGPEFMQALFMESTLLSAQYESQQDRLVTPVHFLSTRRWLSVRANVDKNASHMLKAFHPRRLLVLSATPAPVPASHGRDQHLQVTVLWVLWSKKRPDRETAGGFRESSLLFASSSLFPYNAQLPMRLLPPHPLLKLMKPKVLSICKKYFGTRDWANSTVVVGSLLPLTHTMPH